jgi:hypothetical protein
MRGAMRAHPHSCEQKERCLAYRAALRRLDFISTPFMSLQSKGRICRVVADGCSHVHTPSTGRGRIVTPLEQFLERSRACPVGTV